MLHVIAKITAKPEHIATVRDILLAILEPTRREVGCVSYRLFQNRSDPTDFSTMEAWASADAEQAHCSSPHITAAIARLTGLVAATPNIQRYAALD